MPNNAPPSEPIEAETPRAVFAVDRAIGDLRRGGTIVLSDGRGGASLVMSTEYATERRLAALSRHAGGAVSLVLTAHRARASGRTVPGGDVVALTMPEPLDAAKIHDLSDATAPSAGRAAETAAFGNAVPHERDTAAVALAKLGSLLPAVLTKSLDEDTIADLDAWAHERGFVTVEIADITQHRHVAATTLNRVSTAQVPLADAENTTIVAFRPSDGGTEHLAIVIGAPDGAQPVLARLHSQCFTGDLLGSLRCDCGSQLRGATQQIADAGAGVILYLAQEGRGIGLVNKLRAYALQDRGLDTYEANQQLGFDADERHYLVAAEMLRQLGFRRVRLLTNNPDKIAALQRSGIDVVERVPHAFPPNGHNERYMETKAARGGHLI